LPDSYGASFAHAVRVDPEQNVWIVDEGSNTVQKVDPTGLVKMVLGRKPESIDWWLEYVERGQKDTNPHPNGAMGTFNRPTDVAWGPDGSIYITDGYGNSRVVKISADGVWQKAFGTYGSGDGQMKTPHSVAVGYGHVFVADRNNSRIQVYDTELNYKRTYTGMGSPWGICVSPGSPQYLFSGDGTTGKMYKMDLSGKVLGWAQTSLGHGEDDTGRLVHEISCSSTNVVYLGSAVLWNVQKVTIK
jgi:streptogramin lyase